MMLDKVKSKTQVGKPAQATSCFTVALFWQTVCQPDQNSLKPLNAVDVKNTCFQCYPDDSNLPN